jgi:hypothetical protein
MFAKMLICTVYYNLYEIYQIRPTR